MLRGLTSYPVKSCKGIELQSCAVAPTGLRYDRAWMVVKRGEGAMRMMTQRQYPKLALVSCDIPAEAFTSPSTSDPEGFLRLSFGGESVAVPLRAAKRHGGGGGNGAGAGREVVQARVWEWEGPCFDEGEDAARFFTSLLETPCRLVRFDQEGALESSLRPTDADYAPDSQTGFSDGFPFLIASQESLRAVNDGIAASASEGQAELPMNRFRPNLVVSDCGGAFGEDEWASLAVRGGDSGEGGCVFDLVKPCSRCTVTTVNQSTGAVDGKEPLRVLGEIHSGKAAGYGNAKWERVPFFGWNAVTSTAMVGRVISVGASVCVTKKKEEKGKQ